MDEFFFLSFLLSYFGWSVLQGRYWGVGQDDMNCAEDYVRFLCQWLLDHCLDDMKFMATMYDKSAVDRLRMVASTPFKRITYTEAIEILEKVVLIALYATYGLAHVLLTW